MQAAWGGDVTPLFALSVSFPTAKVTHFPRYIMHISVLFISKGLRHVEMIFLS
jgi:hypothetical protein